MSKIKFLLFQLIIILLVGFGASLLFIENSYAQESIYPLALRLGVLSELRTVRNEDQSLSNSQISGFEIGLVKDTFTFLVEGNSFLSNAGSDQILIKSSRKEVYFWIDWATYQTKYVDIYGGFGIGGSQTTVESNIVGAYAKDKSGIEGIGGGAFGVQFNLFKKRLLMQLEGRGLVAQSFEPSPTTSVLIKVVFTEPFFE